MTPARGADAFPPLNDLSGAGAARGAHVVLRDAAGRFLCQLRDDAPAGRPAAWGCPGLWGLFGGGIEADEAPHEAALREVAEETGLALDAAALRPVGRAVLHATPRAPLLWMFAADVDAAPADLRLREGAGFAFLTLAQARRMDFIPEHLRAMEVAAR